MAQLNVCLMARVVEESERKVRRVFQLTSMTLPLEYIGRRRQILDGGWNEQLILIIIIIVVALHLLVLLCRNLVPFICKCLPTPRSRIMYYIVYLFQEEEALFLNS